MLMTGDLNFDTIKQKYSFGTLYGPTLYNNNLIRVGKFDSMNLGVMQTMYCIDNHYAISFIFPAR